MEPTNTNSEPKLDLGGLDVRETVPCPPPSFSSCPPESGVSVEFPRDPRLPNLPGVILK